MSLSYARARSSGVAAVGPKAFKLAELAHLTSIPVNPGMVLPWPQVEALRRAAGLGDLLAAARAGPATPPTRQRIHELAGGARGGLEAMSGGQIEREIGVEDDAWRDQLGLAADGTVIVRTSPISVARPREELEGVGSSRVCAVADVPVALRDLVLHLLDADRLLQLASLAPGDVRLAFLVHPFPAHGVAGVCASFDVRTTATDVFELQLGHGQLYGITRGYTAPDSYLVDRTTGVVRSCELGHARDAVDLDEHGRYRVRALPAATTERSVAAVAGLDLPALLGDFWTWVEEIRAGLGRDRFHLEFCIDTTSTVVVTDIRYAP